MKKFLLTTTMLVGFVAIAQAQQGRVGINTTTPGATLDIAANTTDATRPDAVLVPRMTAAELNAKNAAYVAAQNGALVFVTSGTGVAATKTANVTGTGFYYYNSTTQLWVAVGGGASTQRYEGTRGNATILTTTAAYTAIASDFIIVTKAAGALTIDLPDPATNIGRVIIISNNNTGSGFVTVQSAGGNTLSTGTLAQNRGKVFVSDGTSWIAISYS